MTPFTGRTCKHCGERFDAHASNQIFCSQQCYRLGCQYPYHKRRRQNPTTRSKILSWQKTYYQKHRAERLAKAAAERLARRRPPSDFSALSAAELGYAAGILDGEGYLGLGYRQPGKREISRHLSPQLNIGNTDVNVLLWFKDRFGGKVVPVKQRSKELNRKPFWLWRIQGAFRVGPILKAVLPYLIIKAERAGVLLEAVAEMATTIRGVGQRLSEDQILRRQELKLRIRALNKRGVA